VSILGLIPARSGSKRLPGKNLKLMCGRPLIAHVILEALKTVNLKQVHVTSEDDEILETARYYGADTIKRPRSLAHDKALVYGAITHAIDAVGGCEAVCLIQCTSPLTKAEHIDRTIDAYLKDGKPQMTVTRGYSVANGAVYVGSVEWLRHGGNWDDGSPGWVQMEPHESCDINTYEDFKAAEMLMLARMAA
jgi:CMP-N-acetylneuraminic acid synthetase